MGRNARAADGVAAHPATRGAPGSQAAAPVTPVVHVLASPHGGGAVHVRTLTAGLARRGVPVLVALPWDGGHVSAEDFVHAGVGIAQWRMDCAWRSVASLAAILRTHRPRLIHTHGARAAAFCWAAMRIARLPHSALVHSAHGYVTPFHTEPRRFIQHLVERTIGHSCHVVLAGSQHERAALVAGQFAAPERLMAVPQGVDTARFASLSPVARAEARARLTIDDRTFVVVAVCRLDRPRDFPTLLNGYTTLLAQHPNSLLLIVGDGPERDQVDALIRQLRLHDHVVLSGWQRDPQLYYAAADAFVSTSYGWEALGIATIEAQAAALPVVVTDAGGAAEAFVPGASGLLVPRQDPEALGNALRRLAADPELRRRMGDQGRAHVTTHFGVEPMIDAVLAVYRTVQ